LLVVILARDFQIPRVESTSTDVWVLIFTFGLSIATGVFFGVAPALAAISRDSIETLRNAGRSMTEGGRGRRLRAILVVAETSLALVLLASAGLLLKSFLTMRSTAPGFQPDNLLAVDMRLPRLKFAHLPERVRYFDDIVSRVGSAPGVRSAALVADLPLGGGSDSLGFHIPGRPDPAPGTAFSANFNIASAGYFRSMGIPLREGREFGAQDHAGGQGVIVVNETAAQEFWPGESAIGKQIALPGPNNTSDTLTVVGITGDVRQADLGRQPRPEIFLDYQQSNLDWLYLVMVVRTEGDPAGMAGGVRSIAQQVDPDVPISQIRPMRDVLSGSLAQPRAYTLLLNIFASLAIALAAVGLYGVVSYTAARRTHEMGIRMALGAGRADVLRLVLGHALGLSILGAVIGLGGAVAVARLLTNMVASVHPGDWLPFLGAAALLLGVALVASLLPARRAARVDPAVALRYE
jgi:putative ABC transport system permease protein